MNKTPPPSSTKCRKRRWVSTWTLFFSFIFSLDDSASTCNAFSSSSPSPSSFGISRTEDKHSTTKTITSLQSSSSPLSTKDTTQSKTKTSHLITFDLDDTLFPIAPVIKEANAALIQELKSMGYPHTTEDDIISSTKYIRSRLDDKITYTELRKRAIRREMESDKHEHDHDNGKGTAVAAKDVERVYDAWETERHASAERHLYPDAISMLRTLRSTYSTSNSDLKIGAVTNGKGSPLFMKGTIAEYFDFCVSGEDDDVFPNRKPMEGIYLSALNRYRSIVVEEDDGKSEGEEGLNLNWFHIGDDLANDVGASAKCGALAIWVDLDEDYNQTASKRTSTDARKGASEQPKWSTASKEELEERRILNEKAERYVSARVERLEDLPDAIAKLLL